MSKAILSIQGLSFHYPLAPPLLNHIALEVEQGELITMLGANGYGKSTLLHCIMGFQLPQQGIIYLDGRPLKRHTAKSIATHLAYVAQTSQIRFQHLVRDYIAMGRAPYLNMFQRPGREDYVRVDEVMEQMGITALAGKIYTKLSGGERQMADICRAIVQEPKLILFDEPTAALDYGNQIRVLKVVKELSRQGYAILMTTHNPEHPILLKGNVCILSRDGTLTKGSVEESITEERLNELYRSKLKIRYNQEVERLVCMIDKI